MNSKYKLTEDKYAGTQGMFKNILDKWDKESKQDKLKEKVIQARKKLDAERANISDEEYKEAKDYIDSTGGNSSFFFFSSKDISS